MVFEFMSGADLCFEIVKRATAGFVYRYPRRLTENKHKDPIIEMQGRLIAGNCAVIARGLGKHNHLIFSPVRLWRVIISGRYFRYSSLRHTSKSSLFIEEVEYIYIFWGCIKISWVSDPSFIDPLLTSHNRSGQKWPVNAFLVYKCIFGLNGLNAGIDFGANWCQKEWVALMV